MKFILKTTPVALYFSAFVMLLMHVVMYTAKDRGNYLRHFSDPFNNRLEPLFQWYMWFLDIFLTPHVAIMLTCTFIYLLFYKVWSNFRIGSYLLFFLFFNVVAFGVFNYYLGTSIRMGLAIAVGLYSAIKILEGVKSAWIGLILSPLLHYGLVLFLVYFIWYSLTKSKGTRFHCLVSVATFVFLVFLFDRLLSLLGLNSYYMMYFTEGFGQTERLIPFTVLYFFMSFIAISLFLTNNLRRTIPKFDFLYLSALYALPIVIYQLVSGIAIFSKMLMPQFFLLSILLAYVFDRRFYHGNARYFYVVLFFAANIIAILYALRMYQFI
ncbi:EpsG family protein [Salinivibrio kushneri]|uniref:EpsG family protein n=1 Tax=Salinivibrio kushneri TaxID=1908198 RepID=UPI000C865220|nr:EpsG family protein [Salinivibrio kushneri]